MTTSELSWFKAAFMQSWNAIVITDADGAAGYRVQFANPAFCSMTGYALDELRGCTLQMLQGPDTDPAVIDDLRVCLREARYFEGTTINYRKDGASYVVRWNISPVRDDEGVLTHFMSVQQDISDIVRAAQENLLLARALNATSAPVVLTDARARITFVNTAFAKVTGYTIDEVRGKTPAMFQSGAHDAAFYRFLRASLDAGKDFRATFVNRRRDGSLYHSEQSISPLCDDKGRVTHYVSVSKDISDRVEKEQALLHEASHDKLTGLHNRRYGEQTLGKAILAAHTQGRPLTLLVCDIDHFKQVNDRFGHLAGDRVLRDVAHILRSAVRSRDCAIRWGGEEFLVLLEHCEQAPGVVLAERIRRRVEAHGDAEVGKVTLSLGLATLKPDETMEQLIARADEALYEAKHGGRNRLLISQPHAITR
ncbi:sensor domain-containing diguanylate cyclase [Acidovorax soli]|uniref:sensor domain-containing diguanylate cyclase n=1 Tax=Acidovorax TaxID=12916 RepID=UPI0026F02811|nr:diguanylate cyclase [Acidovorax soli]MCM2347993.1 diguanylate cyclase [Acidovorax soli]